MGKNLDAVIKSLGLEKTAQRSAEIGVPESRSVESLERAADRHSWEQALEQERRRQQQEQRKREQAMSWKQKQSSMMNLLQGVAPLDTSDPMKGYLFSELTPVEIANKAKEKKTAGVQSLQTQIDALEAQKKPVGMDQTNAPHNRQIDEQIKPLRESADSAMQEAADVNQITLALMSDADRKALSNYVNQRRTDWYDTLTQGVYGNGVIGTPGGRAEAQVAELARKYGWDNVKSLAETLERQQNAEATARAQQEGAELGQEHPILGSAASIPLNVVSGAPAVFERIRGLGTSTGQYPTLDPNNAGNLLGTVGSAIQGQVASDIEGDDPNLLRKAGAYAYRGGMSALESGLRAATGKAGTVLLSGLGSFEQNVAKASAQGASPEKAVAMGLTNATIEALSEEIPLDNLMEQAKHSGKGFGKVLKNALIQAGIEASTEEASLIGTTLAEAAILQDDSEKAQYIQSRMEEGADYQTASKEWFQGLLDEAVDTAIVSGISGGLMSGAQSVRDYRNSIQAQAQQDARQAADNKAQRQAAQQATETPMQGEAADPRHQKKQQAEAREAAQAMEQAQQAQQAAQPPATHDPLLEGIQTPVAPTQEQTRQQDPVANMLNPIQNPQQSTEQETTTETSQPTQPVQPTQAEDPNSPGIKGTGAADTPQEAVKPANAALDKVTNATIAEGSVKSQIRRSQETLNAMDAVAEIQTPSQFSAMDKSQKINWVVDKLKPTNYEVDRKGFGVIKFAKKQLKSAFNYFANGGAEEATFEAIPYVLQNGVEISSHADHKGREYGTVTFAAPVLVDGQRGNMAVVVKQTTDNTYKVHRILTPDGSVFNLSDTKVEAEPTPAGESPKNGSLATPISSASDISIPTVGENVNGNMENPAGSSDVKAPSTQPIQQVNTEDVPTREVTSPTKVEGQAQLNLEQQVQTDTTGKQSTPSGDFKASRTYTNSGLHSNDADIRAAYRDDVRRYRDNPYYEEKHNADTRAAADERVSAPERVSAEYDYLMRKDAWTAEDNTTARLTSRELFKQGDGERSSQLNKKIQQINTNAGQVIQSNAQFVIKDASDPFTTAESAAERINKMQEQESTYKKTKDGPTFEDWKDAITKNVTDIAIEIDSIEPGDTASMREIVRKIARQRKTTAWFGASNNLTVSGNTSLNTLNFDDLKMVANTQLLSMTDDFRRRNAGDVMNGIRKQSMLSSLKTFNRNLMGNSAVGLLDSFGDSTTGAIMDRLLSKVTGKRTTSNDFFRPVTYLKNAKNAGSFASLCVELNIPIETDVESSYASAYGEDTGGKYVAKTFRSTGNIGMRALYAYQKYQSYALEVSDKIFEGGTKGAVDASLEKLNSLNADERQRLVNYTANRRTFKDATWEGPDGRTHGSALSRGAQKLKRGVGNIAGELGGERAKAVADTVVDAKVPFVQVPVNVAQTGTDYSIGGVKGAAEIVSLIVDAKKGVDIPVERQRQAVSDFGRGMTGLALIGLAAAAAARGIIRVGDDDDKDADALHQSEGRSGAQINWSAWKRDLNKKSAQWQPGDTISSLDSVEPFNTHMYLGVDLAQEDGFLDILKAYPKATFESSFNAFMDSPMVSGLREMGEDISEVVRSDDKAETIAESLAEGAGSYVSSYIPQFARQTAQYTDGYYRDTRGTTKAETAWNQVKNSIPGMSQTLPLKLNGFGEPQKRPGFTQTFIDPTNTASYQPNKTTTALDALADQTGDKSIYPDYQAPMKIRVSGEDIPLDGNARTTYQETYGQSVDALYRGLLDSPGFSGLPQEAQTEALNKAEQYATDLAKASVSDYSDAPDESLNDLVSKIITDTATKRFTDAFKDISNAQKYNKDTAESIAALENAYAVYTGLPSDLKKQIDDSSGGRVEYFLNARKAGIPTEQFTKMYDQYKQIGDTDMGTTQKAKQWSYTLEKAVTNGELTETQKNTLKESMVFRYSTVAKTEKFDEMVENGVSEDNAYKVGKLLDGIQGTGAPDENGEPKVTNQDKYAAIASSDLPEKDKELALMSYLQGKLGEKYEYARDEMQLNVEDFVDAYRVTSEYSRKEQQISAWMDMGYTKKEANNLYKLYKGKLT